MIQFPTFTNDGQQEFIIPLEGYPFRFVINYNNYMQLWYMTIYQDDTIILASKGLTISGGDLLEGLYYKDTDGNQQSFNVLSVVAIGSKVITRDSFINGNAVLVYGGN